MADYDVNSLLGIGPAPATEDVQEPKSTKTRPKKQTKPKKADTRKKATPSKDFIVPKRELYSRRVDLLLKPSTYDKLKAMADANGVKVNALANAIFEDYLK